MGWAARIEGLRDAELPADARRRTVGGSALVLVALPTLVLATWVWPAGFDAHRFGRDVGLAIGGTLVGVVGLAVAWVGIRRALQGLAMGRPSVPVEVSGHRRFAIRRRTGAGGHEDARHYLRLEVVGRRPLGVRVDEDLARRFRVRTSAELWRLGPVASLRVDDEVLHLTAPAVPFPRETEPL